MSLYGCVLWSMSDQYIERFFVTWRKCLRKLYNVPQITHNNYLHLLVEDISVDVQIHIAFIKFLKKSVISSENNIVKLCGKLALKGSGSTIFKNINYTWYKYSLSCSKYKPASYFTAMNSMKSQCGDFSTGDDVVVSNKIELIQMRDCRNSVFSLDEIDMTIAFFCK